MDEDARSDLFVNFRYESFKDRKREGYEREDFEYEMRGE